MFRMVLAMQFENSAEMKVWPCVSSIIVSAEKSWIHFNPAAVPTCQSFTKLSFLSPGFFIFFVFCLCFFFDFFSQVAAVTLVKSPAISVKPTVGKKCQYSTNLRDMKHICFPCLSRNGYDIKKSQNQHYGSILISLIFARISREHTLFRTAKHTL